MHIAVFEVLYPVHKRAADRLGRWYVISIEEARLTTQRSGPIRPSSVHVEHFETHEELITNVQGKIRRRAYHGYVLIWWSEGFPLLEWIRDHQYTIEYKPIAPPYVQLELPSSYSPNHDADPSDE